MTSLLFPQIIDGVVSATVRRWLKRPGESFSSGDAIVELEGEESSILVIAEEAGQLTEVRAQLGQTVRAGVELARIKSYATEQPQVAKKEKAEIPVPTDRPAAAGKVIPILMPQAGNTMEEGTVIAWRVKPGDTITVGQIICEIETDKATMEFESPDAGRLAKIVATEGEPIAVKQPIALLADSDDDVAAYLVGEDGAKEASNTSIAATKATPNDAVDSRVVSTAPVAVDGRVKASPAARMLASERGISLAAVGSGSGPDGRILSTDLNNVVVASIAKGSSGEVRKPLSKMRRAIGLNLQQSKQTVPHFYVRLTIDADPLLTYYREQKSSASCSLNDVVVLAVGRAIRDFPAVRSQVAGNEIIEYPHANIGIAVGVDDGLVVPVVLAVDTLTLSQLAAEAKRVVENSRKGKLENIGKGHFTISNLGMFGVDEFSAIINPPESGILAVGTAKETVVVENGAMRAGRTMTMTLSADHRIVDGVMAAKFMARLKAILENPSQELA